jgi:hypothetical protein
MKNPSAHSEIDFQKNKLNNHFFFDYDFSNSNILFKQIGVTLINVERLNLLKVAPGGHLGRFCIWTESAFRRLDEIYGTYKQKSSVKNDFRYFWFLFLIRSILFEDKLFVMNKNFTIFRMNQMIRLLLILKEQLFNLIAHFHLIVMNKNFTIFRMNRMILNTLYSEQMNNIVFNIHFLSVSILIRIVF